MMDSQETLQTEENVTENATPEVNETDTQTVEVPKTQEEVVARVKELAQTDAIAEKQQKKTELLEIKRKIIKIIKRSKSWKKKTKNIYI